MIFSRNAPDAAAPSLPPEAPTPARRAERYLLRVRLRAFALYGARALFAGAGAGLFAFALVAFGVGPVATAPAAAVGFCVTTAATVAALMWALRGLGRVRGAGAARLFAGVRDDLASSVRSAVELGRDPVASTLAPDLVRAHAARVTEALDDVPLRVVVPLRWLRHPAPVLGVVLAAGAGLLLTTTDRSAAGAFALMHPGHTDEGGVSIAAVVASVDARLVFPGYLGRPPVTLHDVASVEAPRGTSIELSVLPRVDAVSGTLEIAGSRVQLAHREDGALAGRFVVRDDGILAITIADADGGRFRDPSQRPVRVVPDLAPRVAMTAPETDLVVELDDDVTVTWEATDDVGLRSVDLVVRTGDGRETRRRIADLDDTPELSTQGEELIIPSALGARPGDQLRLFIEARDGDEVSGPNIGRSTERTITIASEATRRAEALDELSQVLGLGLDALADRLENEVPEHRAEAETRQHLTRESSDRFAAALSSLATSLAGHSTDDASLYREMGRRIERLVHRETRLYGVRPAALRRRVAADTELVERLEADVLLLSDTVARGRIEDAAAIAREVEALRREMSSLLAELRRADTPEARAELASAIARAEQRMQELADRISRMSRDVPSDFVNADALSEEQAESSLDAMREALERGDLDEVERQLGSLRQQNRLDRLAPRRRHGELRGGPLRSARARDGRSDEPARGPRERTAAARAAQHRRATPRRRARARGVGRAPRRGGSQARQRRGRHPPHARRDPRPRARDRRPRDVRERSAAAARRGGRPSHRGPGRGATHVGRSR